MLIPSFYHAPDGARPWRIARAAAYGAGIGALAALLKALGPLHEAIPSAGTFFEISAAAVAFAVLCAGAAALRNFLARRLLWRV